MTGTSDQKAAAGAKALAIPDEIRQKHPELIALILGSESMNDEERQYWINILPVMTPEQIGNLKDILINEKTQLEAIDKKYAADIEQIGQQQLLSKTSEERHKRRLEREQQEQQHQAEESRKEEEILRKIEQAS
ncbi:MAG: hypothetical protein PHO92_01625 [Candidatus Peribacteraceae bacterium]|nr:hypothetical protein [Candidatus Peribacteraceae bacterium]